MNVFLIYIVIVVIGGVEVKLNTSIPPFPNFDSCREYVVSNKKHILDSGKSTFKNKDMPLDDIARKVENMEDPLLNDQRELSSVVGQNNNSCCCSERQRLLPFRTTTEQQQLLFRTTTATVVV